MRSCFEFTISFKIYYEFTLYFAYSLLIHCPYRESSENSRGVLRILFEFNWCSENKLWIHFLFLRIEYKLIIFFAKSLSFENSLNSLHISRINYEFTTLFANSLSILRINLNSLSFVRIHNRFTIFSRSYYEFTIFAN